MGTSRRAIACSVQRLLSRPSAVSRPPAAPAIAACSSRVYPNAIDAATRSMVNRYCLPLHSTVLVTREMSCCAGLGSPPPREIVVEYSSNGEGDDYTDEFIKLANEIEERFPEFIVSGNPEELQPREGAFEITAGDAILFSKLQTERLPELNEVVRAIGSLPPAECTIS